MLDLLNVKEILPKFPIETYYKEYKENKRDNPFSTVVIDAIHFGTYVDKSFTLLPGIQLEANEKPTSKQVTASSYVPTITVDLKSVDGSYACSTIIWGLDTKTAKAKDINKLQRRLVNLVLGVADIDMVELKNQLSVEHLSELINKPIEVKASDTMTEIDAKALTVSNQFEGIVAVLNQDGFFHKGSEKFPYCAKLVRKYNDVVYNNVELCNLGFVIQKEKPDMVLKIELTTKDVYTLHTAPSASLIAPQANLHNDIASSWGDVDPNAPF